MSSRKDLDVRVKLATLKANEESGKQRKVDKDLDKFIKDLNATVSTPYKKGGK